MKELIILGMFDLFDGKGQNAQSLQVTRSLSGLLNNLYAQPEQKREKYKHFNL